MMRTPLLARACAALVAVMISSTSAVAAIDVWFNLNADVFVTEDPPGSGRYTVDIFQVNGGVSTVGLDSTTSTDVIELITVYGSGTGSDRPQLTIRRPGAQVLRSSLAGVESIVVDNPSQVALDIKHLALDGNIGSPTSGGDIESAFCEFISIGGDWYADVRVNNQTGFSPTATPITARIDGAMAGGCFLYVGNSIDLFRAGGGITSGPNGTARIWAEQSIDEIVVIGDASVRIGEVLVGLPFVGVPDIGTLRVQGSLFPMPMTMNSLGSLFIENDYVADIEVLSAMAPSSIYEIGGSIGSSGRFTFPNSGLQGQIITNSNGVGGVWDGDIVVGTTSLAPDYTNLPASIGGGAVGVVPFSIHDQASTPASGSATLHASDAPPAEAVAEYYGPVELLGAAPHFTIERRLDNGDPACPWVDVTSGFSASVVAGGQDRRVRFSPTSGSIDLVYEYRVTPEPGKVVCAGIDGDPDVAAEMYTFTLESDLEEDLNADGEVNATDLGILIAAWGQSCVRSDFNGDGDVGSFDLGTLITAWTGEEPPPESPNGRSGSGHPVLDALGFDTIEGYQAWLQTLTTAEMDAHLQDLLELVQAL